MGDDFYFGNYDGQPQRRDNMLLWLADVVMWVLTLLFVAAGVLTLIVPHVEPAKIGVMSVLALAAPLFYVGITVTTLYWIVRSRWVPAAISAAAMVAGLFVVPLYYRPEIRRSYGLERYPTSALKVMSYNLRCFYSDDGLDYTVDSVGAFVRSFNPDIVCFQEFMVPSKFGRRYLDSVMGHYDTLVVLDDARPQLAILSRYKVVDTGRVTYRPNDSVAPRGKALWVDLEIGPSRRRVRVYNVHLNSTSINTADADYIVNYRYMSDTARNGKLTDMFRRLSANTIDRASHVDTIAAAMRASEWPAILCGDFNDTPMSYAYHTLADGMQDAFSAAGRGYSHTFRGFFNTLRIDYALFDPDAFEILSYDAPDSVVWSDHLPVCVRAKFKD